jgi:hypothetical protein
MAQQVKSITNEALEAAYRALTPSQEGFTEDLMASNTIIPVISLNTAAEGSTVPEFLQRAWDISTDFYETTGAAATTVVNSTGFWQFGVSVGYNSAHANFPRVYITDGIVIKPIWAAKGNGVNSSAETDTSFTVVAFIKAGESLVLETYANQKGALWVRQIADVNGVLVNPTGFTPQ